MEDAEFEARLIPWLEMPGEGDCLDPFFRELARLARPETGQFIETFLERDEADIEQMVETFS